MSVDEILKSKLGIESLNAMQRAVAASNASKMIVLSPTGSGKTVAFTLPLVRDMMPSGYVQGLVIVPSRELAIQVAHTVRAVGQGLKVTALYGGRSMRDETPTLTPPPDVVVATLGRLLDHINRGEVDISGVKRLVLDEYDKCLALGFHDDMRRIVRRVKYPRLVVLTSATALEETPDFIDLTGAETLDFVGADSDPRERMDIVEVPSATPDKLDTLVDLLRSLPRERVMVFANHRESAERIYQRLEKEGFPVVLYHGGLDQQQREMALATFDNGSRPVMVTTDLGARGLDIAGVGAVVHYHVPVDAEAWTHRNGRTARVDARGTVYVIVSEKDTLPEWIDTDRQYVPTGKTPADGGIGSDTATIYLNLGRKNKVSRGDVAGFLIKEGGLQPNEIGKIEVRDRYALAAVPQQAVGRLLKLAQPRLKAQRVRLSAL